MRWLLVAGAPTLGGYRRPGAICKALEHHMKYRLKVRPPKRTKGKHLFSEREKMELAIRCKVRGEDPQVVMPPAYERHKLSPPKHPSQALSSFFRLFENRLGSGDQVARDLAGQYDLELEPIPE
jgi:hypothetical protein